MYSKACYQMLIGVWHLLKQVMAFGNPTFGGVNTVEEALRLMAELNKRLRDQFGIEFAVSAHLIHEVQADPELLAVMGVANNPKAISLNQWLDGAAQGIYAPPGRMVPPGFGLPWSDEGAFINPRADVREFATDLLVDAFRLSEQIHASGIGLGNSIYWTGPDGIRWRRLANGENPILSYETVPELEEWNLVVNGVAQAVLKAREQGYTNTALYLEGKAGGDPCWIDVFVDIVLTLLGINQMNDVIGAPVVSWQGEFCHERGGGMRFADSLEAAIAANLFDGAVHMNAGPIASQNFSRLLEEGTPLAEFQQYVDPDLLVGQGPEEWLHDQRQSILAGLKWSHETGQPFQIEFDARHCREEDMVGSIEKSTQYVVDIANSVGATALPIL